MSRHVVIAAPILALLALSGNNESTFQSTGLKRQVCDDYFTMHCGLRLNQTGKPFVLYRHRTNRIGVKFSTNCKYDSVLYLWEIHYQKTGAFYHKDNSSVKVVQPFEWKKGAYYILIHVTLERDGVVTTETRTGCIFEVEALEPVAVIAGGSHRMVEAGKPVYITSNTSIDRDSPGRTHKSLVVQWSCVIMRGGQLVQICGPQPNTYSLQLEPSLVKDGLQYIYTLGVRSRSNPTDWVYVNQTITISEGATSTEIICEKNCPPAAAATDRKRMTFLRVKCLSNCEGIEESSYRWTVQGNFDYEKDTQNGRNTDKFIIKEDVLDYGRQYNVNVKLTDRPSLAEIVLHLPTPVKITKCDVRPSTGTALSTKFTVGCDFTGTVAGTEVYTVKNEKSIIQTSAPVLDFLEFLLPPNVDVYLRMTDINDLQDVYKLDVTINPSRDDLDTLLNSLNLSVSVADLDTTIQIITGIIEDISQKPPSEAKPIKESLLKILEQTKMDSRDEARQISSMVTALVYDPQAESDPHQGEKATRICKEASRVYLESVKNESFPSAFAEENRNTAETLMSCAETDTKENLGTLEPESPGFDVSTPFPVLEVPVIEEEYPDYETDDAVFDKRKKYEVASENFVEICKKSLESLSLTLVEGEETVTVKGTNSSAQITKVGGETLANKEIEIRGASLKPSRDFEGVAETIEVMVCAWAYNPFWWSTSEGDISTNVVLIRFLRNGEEMRKFEKPNRIVFDVHEERKLVTHQVGIVNNSVLRIDAKKDQGFFVRFRNLSDTDSLRVLMTNFHKPTKAEVMTVGRLITKSDNFFFQNEENGFDSWYYLSVLPEPHMNQDTFWVNIYTQSCYSWSTEDKTWTFACKGSSRSVDENMECLCTHLSILTGQVYNTRIKIDTVTTEPDVEMVLVDSYIIFISLTTTLVLYFFLSTLTVCKRSSKTTNLFLPGDISTSARYVYLVGIRTGNKASSGTSSNICIKLFGTQRQSKSHVLNYPDPQKKIFERNSRDWFVVPTSHRLGNLTQIALWSDYSGRNPSWYCWDVTVYDLQSTQRWYFDVNTWFTLPPRGRVYVEVQSSDEKKTHSGMLLRLWPKWTYQGFNYFQKLTFLLSIILTISVLCMVLYGVPSLTIKDGFARVLEYKFYWSMVWVGCGSAFGTFAYHMLLVWFYRNSGDGSRFPKKVKTLCWVLINNNIIIAVAVLIIFGFWVPTMTGYLWLTSIVIATAVYFLVLENFYELLAHYHADEKLSWQENFAQLIKPIEAHRAHLFQKFGEHLLRPYFKHLYRPMDETNIKEKTRAAINKKKILNLLEDTVMFAVYVTLLYLAIFADKNQQTVENHNQMVRLLSGNQIRTTGYDSIRSIDDIYQYINDTLIPTLHAYQWYGRHVVNDPGVMVDFHNKLLGVARLRQKRVVPHPCDSLFTTNETCRLEFVDSQENTEGFGADYNDLDRLAGVWNYTKATKAGLSVYVGKFGIYSGGGFVAPLGRTRFNSYANLIYLKNKQWLDSSSSFVIVEFLAYNVNSNLFSTVKVVLERSSTGYTRSRIDLSVSQFLFVHNEQRLANMAIFFSFSLVVGIFTVKFFSRFWKEKLLMWKDLWTLVDLLIIVLSYASFVIFLHRASAVRDFLHKIETVKKNEFIQYFHLLHEDVTYTLLAAFLVFVATIRLWKVCRFGIVFRIMEKTLLLSCGPVLLVLLFHMTLLTAFALSGNVIFGSSSTNFKDIPDTFITLVLLMFGLQKHFHLAPLILSNPDMGKAYYTAYMLLCLFFVTVYVCVIMMHYYQARLVSSEEFTNVVKFFTKQFAFYRTSMKVGFMRLKGGTSKRHQFVIPKEDDLRFADCKTLSSKTLELMACIVLHDLKKYAMTTDEKLKLMERVARCCLDGDDNDVFYAERDDNRVIRIIHDDKVKRVAAAAERILSSEDKKRERRRKKYRRMMNEQLLKLDFIKQTLETVLRILSNIEVQ